MISDDNLVWSEETVAISALSAIHDEDIERACRSLKALAHPLRLKILCILREQEFSVQDLVEQVGTSQSNVSQHLAILREKGILACRKEANRVYYRVVDNRTLRLLSLMHDVFAPDPANGVFPDVIFPF